MPSEIYIKTGTTNASWTAGKAKKIFIKTASAWKEAKNVFLKTSSGSGSIGWLRVWPLSGPFNETLPYITNNASTPVKLTRTSVRRPGQTIRGYAGTWNPNGWNISSYTYYWRQYDTLDSESEGYNVFQTGTLATTANTPTIYDTLTLTNPSSYDRKYFSFAIRANTTTSGIYGDADSDDDYDQGRVYFCKRTPEVSIAEQINVGSKGDHTVAIPEEGDVLTFSCTWATQSSDPDSIANDCGIESDRTITRWYRSLTEPALIFDSRSANGYYDPTGAEFITTSLSYTVAAGDSGYYLFCNQEVFNSGTDFDNAGAKAPLQGGEGTGEINGVLVFNKVAAGRPVGLFGGVTMTRDPNTYTLTATVDATDFTNDPTSYRYQWYVKQPLLGGFYTYTPITGATSNTFDASDYKPSGNGSAQFDVVLPVVWATNSSGESTAGYGLQEFVNFEFNNITSTKGGITVSNYTDSDLYKVGYKLPQISNFKVVAGKKSVTYQSAWNSDDPDATAIIEWVRIGAGGSSIIAYNNTYNGYIPEPGQNALSSGSYTFTLRVSNAGANGYPGFDEEYVYNVVVTDSAQYTFNFNDIINFASNGYFTIDSTPKGTNQLALSGRSFGYYPRDLVVGTSGSVTATGAGSMKYFSNTSNFWLYVDSYTFGQEGVANNKVEYYLRFTPNTQYVDVYLKTKGGSVLPPSFNIAYYDDGIEFGPTLSNASSNSYYRIWSNGTGVQTIGAFTVPDTTLMLDAGALTKMVSTQPSSAADEGYAPIVCSQNQYLKPTITIGTITSPTSTSMRIPFTTGNGYLNYSIDIKNKSTGVSLTGYPKTNQTTNPIVQTTAAGITYTITMTPFNSFGLAGDAVTAEYLQSGAPGFETNPNLSGDGRAGTNLSLAEGTYSGSPTPTVTRYLEYCAYDGTFKDPSVSTYPSTPGDTALVKTLTGTGPRTYTVTHSDATSAAYRFRAVVVLSNASGRAYWTSNGNNTSRTGSVLSYILPTVTTPTLTSATTTGFTINWTPGVSGTTGVVYVSKSDIEIYEVNTSVTPNTYTLSTTITGLANTVSSYAWTGGKANTTYNVKVKVTSTDSGTVGTVPEDPTEKTSVTSNFAASNIKTLTSAAPYIITNPTFTGTGQSGTNFIIKDGSWGGTPTPTVTRFIEWTKGSAFIDARNANWPTGANVKTLTGPNASSEYSASVTNTDATATSARFRGVVRATNTSGTTVWISNGTNWTQLTDSVQSYITPTVGTAGVSGAVSNGFTVTWTSGPSGFVTSTADVLIYDSTQKLIDTALGVTSNTNGTQSSYNWRNGSPTTTYYAKVRVTSSDSAGTQTTSTSFSTSIQTTAASSTYTVSFNGNSYTSGTVPSSITQSSTGASITLPGAGTGTNELKRTDFILSGWNTLANGTGTNYALNGTLPGSAITGNIELFARWLPLYKVTWDKQDGSTTPTVITQQATSGGSVTSPTVSRSGYTFNGWYTASTGGTRVSTNNPYTVTPTANITYYAQWTANAPGTPTLTLTSTYSNMTAKVDFGLNTGSVVVKYNTTNNGLYPNTIGTVTSTGGSVSPTGPFAAGTTFYVQATPYSGTNGTGTAGTAATGSITLKTLPSFPASTPDPGFQRLNSTSTIRWGWQNMTVTGDYTGGVFYQWQYSTSPSTAGVTRTNTRPTRTNRDLVVGGTAYNNRVSSRSGDYTLFGNNDASIDEPVPFSTSARYLRYRPAVVGLDGTTRYGNWNPNWI